MNQLGALYAAGKGCARDDEKARTWILAAAEAGNPIGMYNAGNDYENARRLLARRIAMELHPGRIPRIPEPISPKAPAVVQ